MASKQQMVRDDDYQNGLRESNLRSAKARANLWTSLAAILAIAAILACLAGFGAAVYLVVQALEWVTG